MVWRTLLDFVFPPACVGCDAVGTALCRRCFIAERPLRFTLDDLPCVAVGAYEGILRRAVLALKSGRRDVAEALATLLASCIERSNADVLVPVPTTVARSRERGFDQGVLLAEIAAARTGVPIERCLVRRSPRVQQGRSRAERLASSSRFACLASRKGGARAVLIDDVATTGATLRDCASALAACGFAVCSAVVVARAEESSAFALSPPTPSIASTSSAHANSLTSA